MSVHNPSGLYTAGAERFNSQPTVSLYANLLARKQAKIDALDQYDMKRINSINDAGLRDKDRQAFDQQLQDLRGHYNTSKDKIRKGNTPEAYEYEKKIRDIGSFVNASKERTAKQESAMKFYQERLKQDGVVPDDFIAELDMNDKGLTEENSQTFNLNKWLSSPKPFNQKTYLNSFADIKRTPQAPRYEKVAGNPLKETEIIDEIFDDGGKRVIHARAADKYENSYSFRSQVQNEVKDPIRRKQLGELFKNEFGVDPAMPEDYATAYTMEMLQPKISKVKGEYEKGALMDKAFAQRLKLAAVQNAYIRGRQKTQAAATNLGKYNVVGRYYPDAVPVTTSIVVPGQNGTMQNVSQTEYRIPANKVDPAHKDMFGVDPIQDNKGGYYILTKDGDLEGLGDNNTRQVVLWDVVAQKELDKTAANEEQRGRTNMRNNPTPSTTKPKTETRTFVFPKGQTKF